MRKTCWELYSEGWWGQDYGIVRNWSPGDLLDVILDQAILLLTASVLGTLPGPRCPQPFCPINEESFFSCRKTNFVKEAFVIHSPDVKLYNSKEQEAYVGFPASTARGQDLGEFTWERFQEAGLREKDEEQDHQTGHYGH